MCDNSTTCGIGGTTTDIHNNNSMSSSSSSSSGQLIPVPGLVYSKIQLELALLAKRQNLTMQAGILTYIHFHKNGEYLLER